MPRKARTNTKTSLVNRHQIGAAVLGLAMLGLIAVAGPGHKMMAQGSGPCAPPSSNPVVCENQLTGNLDTEWDVDGAGDPSIQGYTTDISVNKGQNVSFKVDTTASNIRLDIYRMGYYGGRGARKITSINAAGQNQPDCLTNSATGLIDCGNWAVTASWLVPSTSVSGIYFAKAVRLDNGGASHIVFVVRDDSSSSDLLFQTSDTTWQAYNQYGGNSLYVGGPGTSPGRAYKVSYNRPITVRGTSPEDSVFNAEYPMVRWLEANGYNVSYTSGTDSDRLGAELLEHKVFLSVGHDEYWSGAQRTNVEAARAAGVNLAFFSGNEVFWKTRWENSMSTPATAYRTLVSYKETHANAKIDPTANVWTGTWRDPRFSPPADGNRPENALTGTIFAVNAGTTGIRVPAADGKMRFWRGTNISQQGSGGFIDLPFGTLGYEWDTDADNGFRPAGLVRLSDTTASGVDALQDYGSTYASGTVNHALTLYKHASGALVFGAGTVQWSWGLDQNHERGSAAPNQDMQQATVNLFADMKVQPITLQPGLLVAAPSTDTVPPTSTILSPANGAGVPANTTIIVSGTAADSGGAVGGVEVSVDGGTTWRRATGRTAWTYSWQTGAAGSKTIFARAVDDSGNLATSGTGVTVNVGAVSATCPCSIWTPAQSPGVPAENDPSSVEVGTRFRSGQAGYITAIRYYKSSQNSGSHVGNLWTNSGTLLSTVAFVGETSSGWQEAILPSPVAISANTTYVVSYHTNSGFYAGDDEYFASQGVQNGPLYAPRDGEFGDNGVYRYGPSGFPNETYASENYWVDVVFVNSVGPDTTAPTVQTVTPAAGSIDAAANTSVTAVFSESLNASTVTTANFELRTSTNVLVPATVTYSASSRTATLTPSSSLAYSTSYTARVRGGTSGVKDLAGNALAVDYTWSFTTTAPPPPPPTEGPGGPILVVSSTANPFSRYFAEILRAEGLNSFSAMDISTVNATTLSSYDVVILGNFSLTAAQVTMFTNWVNAGGNLVAMRPDKQLASLLGLTDQGTTLAEGYMLVNTGAAPGAGIVSQTMQFHGSADRYALNGATAIATLYSNATTATTNPAVTVRNVGSNGGQAAAFTFDLARSIVYTRQGNPAWAGQERDGVAPIRSDDLFFGGGSTTDWVNLSKVAVPQADEQQRLLGNLIAFVNADRRLLPKFWYFPRGEKAAVVMTGDDHGNNGTTERFNTYKSQSPTNCNVANWECVRGTSYIYPNTPISNGSVANFVADGFEIAVHVSTGCADYTPATLPGIFQNDLGQFFSNYPSITAVRTNRTHCIVFSDYDTQPLVELGNGIRLDTNYYYWPGSWVQNRPGFMTGSGMAMRFARPDGTMIDVYQAATQMTDESDQVWPFTVDALLDKAIGPEGYYGFFVANMHTDTNPHEGSEAIVASALARSVPVISAQQLLTWVDGRNASTFSSITWNGTTLGFTIGVGSGANGLEAMVPAVSGTATIMSVTRNGSPLAYRLETIKGVSYAIFSAAAGAHSVTYGIDNVAPAISAVTATSSDVSAVINWTTNETADSRVDYGTSPTTLNLSASSAALVTNHSIQLSGLTPSTTYYYRVRSADTSGNADVSPATSLQAASFATTATPQFGCPCSIWPTGVPAVASVDDGAAVELGLKFRPTTNGYITKIRFYKGAQNTGSHTANLWTAAGVQLAAAASVGESATGWQEVQMTTPIAVTAGTVYVASYHTTSGFYSADAGYFSAAGVTNGPLLALQTGVSGGNGVYNYGASSFPTQTFNATNYWVDVVFVTSLAADTTPPTVVSTVPTAAATGVSITAPVTVTFNETMSAASISTTSFDLRTSANVIVPASVAYDAPSRTATLTPTTVLANGLSYTATVRSGASGAKDAAGNPLAADVAWAFVTATAPAASVTDTTTADFLAGSGSGIYAAPTGDGELKLMPSSIVDFSGSALPADWSTEAWSAGGVANVAGGVLAVDGARSHANPFLNPGVALEFGATFSGEAFEHVGLGQTLEAVPWAIFSTGEGSALYARTHNGVTPTDTLLSGNYLGAPHTYRIEWTASAVVFAIDGVTVATHPVAIAAQMRPIASNYQVGGLPIQVDWITLSPYATAGTFTSRIIDAGTSRTWVSSSWNASVPPGTSLTISARFGNTPTPDGTWTGFLALTSGGALTQTSRYVQYQVALASTDPMQTPALRDIAFSATIPPVIPVIAVNDVTVAEGNSGTTAANFTVSLSAQTTQTVTVAYTTAAGTATAGSDYTTTAGTLTFTPGVTQSVVTVPVTGDAVFEGDEGFFLNLSSPVNATIGDAQGVGTITNDDAAPQFSIADVTLTEGNTGSTAVTFTVTKTGSTPNSSTVGWTTANNSAIGGSDFTAASGTLTFASNVTSQTFTVSVTGDTLDEDNETFFVNLQNPTGAVLGDGQAVATITDNDTAPNISVNDVTVTEAPAGVNAVFTVSLAAASGRIVTITYTTAQDTALQNVDFTPRTGTLTFNPGTTAQTVSVPVLADALDEATERFFLNLSVPVNTQFGDSQGIGTINDNNTPPNVTVSNASVTEPNSGTVNMTFTVTLSAISGQSVSVAYNTSNGTATAGTTADYTSTSGTLTIAAGQLTGTVNVPVRGDTIDEIDETFNFNLQSASGAVITDNLGVGTIIDNDTATISVSDISGQEGSLLINRTLTFTVTLSVASSRTVTVNYATANNTAIAGSDYTGASGLLTFNPGETSKSVTVTLTRDLTNEPNETFFFNLTNGSNATIADAQAIGTILNDD